MKKIIFAVVLFFLAVSSFGPAWAGEKYGQDISNRKVTAVKEILSDPKAYEGKLVTIAGKIDSECPSGCWFYVKVTQGNASIYVDIRESGFAIPQYVGKQVLVEGTVVVNQARVKIRGLGVEIE